MSLSSVHYDLVSAFDEARVAALHVDMQALFMHQGWDSVFTTVSAFAGDMRAVSVPNYWVAMTGDWQVGNVAEFSERIIPTNFNFHDLILTEPGELVFEKSEQGLFEPRGIKAEYMIKGDCIDTLLITGVKADECVYDTAVGAVTRGFNTHIILDATDHRSKDSSAYEAKILCDIDESLHSHLNITTMQAVHEALQASQRIQPHCLPA